MSSIFLNFFEKIGKKFWLFRPKGIFPAARA